MATDNSAEEKPVKLTIPMRRGRPTVMNKQIVDDLLLALRSGGWKESACAFAGISKDTFYEWLNKGRKEAKAAYDENREVVTELQPYVDFADAIDFTEANSELNLVGIIRAEAKKDPRYAQWLLDRRYKWASKSMPQATDIVGAGGKYTIIIRDAPRPEPKLYVPENEGDEGDEG
jgi:hypothetical protein